MLHWARDDQKTFFQMFRQLKDAEARRGDGQQQEDRVTNRVLKLVNRVESMADAAKGEELLTDLEKTLPTYNKKVKIDEVADFDIHGADQRAAFASGTFKDEIGIDDILFHTE